MKVILVYVISAEVFEYHSLNSEPIGHICGLLDDFEDFLSSHFESQIKRKLLFQSSAYERLKHELTPGGGLGIFTDRD